MDERSWLQSVDDCRSCGKPLKTRGRTPSGGAPEKVLCSWVADLGTAFDDLGRRGGRQVCIPHSRGGTAQTSRIDFWGVFNGSR